ncbi:hypothetical protein PUN28_018454 [Cardiocondyla obscurior]|uniref:Peptidase A2 domain-containing protein n=1 Tax=Cardiocondyla obscurior TaxID=286306 RepID=A0AAW2EJB4_9HYME
MIINNSDLTHVERIHYLKTCLTGEAARLVGNLTASTENFEIACTLLSARYENKRFLITAQLDRIANLKPIKTKIANGLRTPLTTILESLGALRALDCAVQHWNPFMIQHITRLLDPKTRKDWEISLGATEEYPNMKRFQMFLGGRARALENLNTTTFVRNKENHRPFFLINPRHPIRNVAHTATSNSDSTSNKCLLCGATHLLQKCERYVALDSCKRKDFLIKKKRCFNCLGAHMASKCRSTRRCFTCGQKHHTSLHSTSRALLIKSNGEHLLVRLLLDQGSEISFIEEKLVNDAKLIRKHALIQLVGIGGTRSGRTKGMITIQLKSIYDSSVNCQLNAYILPRLTMIIPAYKQKEENWPHLTNLKLADPDFTSPGNINIIIDADNFNSVIQPGIKKEDTLSPMAQLTIFGWVLSGPISTDVITSSIKGAHCYVTDLELKDLISKFWVQEKISFNSVHTRTTFSEELFS